MKTLIFSSYGGLLLNFGKRYKDDIWIIFDQWQKLHLDLDALSNQKILKGIYYRWTFKGKLPLSQKKCITRKCMTQKSITSRNLTKSAYLKYFQTQTKRAYIYFQILHSSSVHGSRFYYTRKTWNLNCPTITNHFNLSPPKNVIKRTLIVYISKNKNWPEKKGELQMQNPLGLFILGIHGIWRVAWNDANFFMEQTDAKYFPQRLEWLSGTLCFAEAIKNFLNWE